MKVAKKLKPLLSQAKDSIAYWNERASQIEWRRGELRTWLHQMDLDYDECVRNIERIKAQEGEHDA